MQCPPEMGQRLDIRLAAHKPGGFYRKKAEILKRALIELTLVVSRLMKT